jgi:hypothetical protein
MAKARVQGWSVAAEEFLNKARRQWRDRNSGPMPADVEAKLIEEAHDKAIGDTFGADWKQHVDGQGKPQEQGTSAQRFGYFGLARKRPKATTAH